MANLKIALIGAGSFVFGPGVLRQVFLENRLNDVELALMDVDVDAVAGMAGVGRRMAEDNGLNTVVTTHTSLDTALEGADFVICSAARQLASRHRTDVSIINQFAPGHLITEFGGIAGISYTARQIALMEEFARVMKAKCPKAWFLNVANPLPRVCQALHEDGIQTVGFCSVSASVLSTLNQLFYGEPLSYPWTRGEERFDITLGGVNHFCWLLEAKDKKTGEDLIPILHQKFLNGATTGNPVCERFARELGYLLLPNDLHTSDFLPVSPETPTPHDPYHGTPQERAERMQQLHDMATGTISYEPLLERHIWERPIDWIQGVTEGKDASFHTISLVNKEGNVMNLSSHLFTETGVKIVGGVVQPNRVTLPASVLAKVVPVAEQHDRLVRACRTRSLALLKEAVEADPTIEDKVAGWQAVEACLAAHSDILPPYG